MKSFITLATDFWYDFDGDEHFIAARNLLPVIKRDDLWNLKVITPHGHEIWLDYGTIISMS